MLLTSSDEQGLLLPNINDDPIDASLPGLNFVQQGQKLGGRINSCQSNSFAFGGNNISLIIGRNNA